MTVGKPDFNLNSFGIQYKEKTVKYTEDLAKVESGQGAVEPDFRQDAKWSKTMPHELPQTRQNSHHESVKPSTRVDEIGKTPKTDSQQPVGKKPKLDLGATDKLQVQQPMKELEQEINTQHKIGNKFPSTSKSPADLKRKAAETIFKAISLKLDLMKTLASNAGSTVVEEGTSPTKPNHIGANGVRTQDGQHTVLAHAIGTPKQETITNADGTKKIINRPRTAEEVTHKKGNEKRSLAGDMQMSKELENKTPEQLKESMDLITNNQTYQEGIHRDAPLTEKEGTDKFDAADPKTQAILARQAKRDAAKKKRGEIVNHAISEINAMTDGMKELMKREGVKIGMGEKDTRQSQDRFNEDHLSDFPEMKGTKEGKEVERHMNDHVSPVDN